MAQQVKKKLVMVDFVTIEQKFLDKQVKRERAQAKMEELLIKLNKEHKPVRTNLHKLSKKVKLNTNYLEDIVSIQEIRYQQVYRNIGIY